MCPQSIQGMAMTPLRQRTLDALELRGLAQRTREAYIDAIPGLAKRYRCSPEQLSAKQGQAYLLHLLRAVDIDSCADRMCIRVEQGKGAKDRCVPLAPDVLQVLRHWWHAARPEAWLFAAATEDGVHAAGQGLRHRPRRRRPLAAGLAALDRHCRNLTLPIPPACTCGAGGSVQHGLSAAGYVAATSGLRDAADQRYLFGTPGRATYGVAGGGPHQPTNANCPGPQHPTHVLRTPTDHLRPSLGRAPDAQEPQDRWVHLGGARTRDQRTAEAKHPCGRSAGKSCGSLSVGRSCQSVCASANHGLRLHRRRTTPEAPIAQGLGQLAAGSLTSRRHPPAWVASRRLHPG